MEIAREVRLENQRSAIEDSAAFLVRELNLLDKAIRECESARNLALKVTSCQLAAAVLQEKLCMAQVRLFNEV